MIPESASVCVYYQCKAQHVVEEWDGMDTAELFLNILDKTGESVEQVLADMAAIYWRQE